MSFEDYLNYTKGDIITLSDIQTQIEFNVISADFRIKDVRKYVHPEKLFTYIGYIAEYKSEDQIEQEIMVLIRSCDEEYDFRVYYMDSDGEVENFPIFTDDGQDLVDRFDVSVNFKDTSIDIIWDKQGNTYFGIEYNDENNPEPVVKTVAEYFTNDENKGNPHCIIEWTGESDQGFVEMWYGCDIQESEIEFNSI